MNKGIDSEQIGSYNELTQMLMGQCISDGKEALNRWKG